MIKNKFFTLLALLLIIFCVYNIKATHGEDDNLTALLAPDKVWFATGVNTGNAHDPTTITWKDFAIDTQYGIEESGTRIHIQQSPGFESCIPPEDFEISTSTRPIPPEYPVPGNGNILDLTIPRLGNVNSPPINYGFCKYELHAKVVNETGYTIYVGNHFIGSNNSFDPLSLVDLVDPVNPTESKTVNSINVFVRAGNYSPMNSQVGWDSPDDSLDSAIADGKDYIKYRADIRDIADNPILPIEHDAAYTGSPGRTVDLTASITNDMVFDLTKFTKPNMPYLTPVRYSNFNVSDFGNWLYAKSNDPDFKGGENNNQWQIKLHRPSSYYHYPLEFSSFAPSFTYIPILEFFDKKAFQINSFDYNINDDALPATAKELREITPETYQDKEDTKTEEYEEAGIVNMNTVTNCGENEWAPPTHSCLTFETPITTGSPKLTTGGIENILSLGSPSEINFKINNLSTKKLKPSGNKASGLSVDSMLQYQSTGNGSMNSAIETRKILDVSTDKKIPDTDYGWTNPFEDPFYATRYEMFSKSSINAQSSPFHDFFQKFLHPPYKFTFDWGIPNTEGIKNDGTYAITGSEGIPKENKPNENGKIDRSDSVDLDLEAGSISSPYSINKTIQFTPQKIITTRIKDKDVQFRLIQDIAYRFSGQPEFAIFSQSPLIPGLDVKDIAMEAVGTVSGNKIATNRQFNTVGSAGTRKLQEQIRKNVANITTGINESLCTLSGNKILYTLPTKSSPDGACVIEDDVNETTFAYFNAGPNITISLDPNDEDGLELPSKPYTLIIKGGANLSIKNNLYYPDYGKPSFGIILIANGLGKGSNLYISPKPTNVAAILYAEGSLISRNNKNQSYYGKAKGNIKDLVNQLYWLGSIASKNTIAGTILKKVPNGVTCISGETKLSCAKRYDLDYLRRFTAFIDTDANTSYIGGNGKFSGGGSCDPIERTCYSGHLYLPQLIQLNGGQIDKKNSKLAPLFIEKDIKALSYPPPGFTISSGLITDQEIRN